ncbi:hypothetical protein [Alicyclobacillus acidiphilus]|uniref:hypothetical protein n=1 Tax=Alicyclobacillus acidiphilus TaxID=182455 RepID=UPI0012EEC187|nr:hypothetical protein [Alicyclobacillus acidiphilus]
MSNTTVSNVQATSSSSRLKATSGEDTSAKTTASVHTSASDQKRAEAKEAVQRFDQIDKEVESDMNQYKSIITGVSNGSLDHADAYNELQSLQQSTLTNTFTDVATMSVPSHYSGDQEEVSVAASYLNSSIGELKNYLNDQQVKELAAAKSDLQSAIDGLNNAMISVAATAIANGFAPPSNSTK